MAWVVKLPDGSVHEFGSHDEADAFAREYEENDQRPPEEIYDSAERPAVTRNVFLRRITMGWKPERALNTTPDGRHLRSVNKRTHDAVVKVTEQLGGRDARMHEAFGRSRTLRQWSEGCGIGEDALRSGARRHGSLEAYFEHIGWHPSTPRTPRTIDPDFD